MLWVYFGKNKDELVCCTTFPKTELSINYVKRMIKHGGHGDVIQVEFKYFTYKEKYDWDFKKELTKMFYNKSVEEIERISELLQAINYFRKYDILEERFHNGQEENYEVILQNLVREISEEDTDHMIPEKLL